MLQLFEHVCDTRQKGDLKRSTYIVCGEDKDVQLMRVSKCRRVILNPRLVLGESFTTWFAVCRKCGAST